MVEVDIISFHNYLFRWYEKNKRSFPWRYTFNPYYTLVSEVLLQHTRAETVVEPYLDIIDKYKSLEELAHGDKEYLLGIFKNLGLTYRAERLISISQDALNRFGGLPDNREDLITLKGIGNYSCNAILCFGFNKACPVVDSNVLRVFELFLDYKPVRPDFYKSQEPIDFAKMVMPEENYVDYNYALLDLGAELRKAEVREELEKSYRFRYD